MAEERNLGVARATDTADEDATKAELQRRMEEARESITQTVTEIKDTVTNQYQAVRQSVTEALDWREQYRRRPVAWSVGALSVGFIVGYSLGGAFTGDGYDDEDDYLSYEEDDEVSGTVSSGIRTAYQSTPAARSASASRSSVSSGPSYVASSYGQATATPAPQSAVASSYSADAQSGGSEAEEEDKPGLLDRFKETRAYDRLQEEVSTLGDRFIDELSKVGTTVVLPLIFTKIKDMFGVDLANKQQGAGGTGARATGTSAAAASTGGAQASTGSSGTDYSGGGGGSSSL
ncbi:MAG: hypothetical protein WCF57_03290 [Pyrinomonadaceae bacterium]